MAGRYLQGVTKAQLAAHTSDFHFILNLTAYLHSGTVTILGGRAPSGAVRLGLGQRLEFCSATESA
jgi:hypothetical protein